MSVTLSYARAGREARPKGEQGSQKKKWVNGHKGSRGLLPARGLFPSSPRPKLPEYTQSWVTGTLTPGGKEDRNKKLQPCVALQAL